MIRVALDLPVLVTGAVIAQGLFAAILLGFTRDNRQANRFLALLLLCFSLWLIDSFYKVGGIYRQVPSFYFQPIFYSFAFGPLIYFYVKSITNASFKFKRKDLLHFIPVVIQAGLYWFLTFQEYSYKRWFWQEVHRPMTYNLEFDFTLLSMAIYLFFSVRLLTKYQAWLSNNFSEFSNIHLNWLRIILSILWILSVFWAIDFISRDFLDIYREFSFSEISLGFVILLLAFGGIRQSNIPHVNFTATTLPQKQATESLDQALIKEIHQRMEKHQDFLHPSLTLQEFAKTLNTPSRTVSRHINQGLNLSFVDFVNQYRVAAIKKKIADGQLAQYTLLSIALESGFNSKSTFNRIFKKHTGSSPSEYLKSSQNKD